MSNRNEKVAIIGAHSKPERYSYKAFKLLQEHGHTPLLVGVRDKEIDGVPVVDAVEKLAETPDTNAMTSGGDTTISFTTGYTDRTAALYNVQAGSVTVTTSTANDKCLIIWVDVDG